MAAMRILGIETSCDETGLAVYDSDKGLLAHALYSQVPLHAQYGGVVPELASRDHIRKTLPLIDQVLAESMLQKQAVDGVAYTAGPGLMGALLVGAAIARSLAWGWQVPAIGIHHMEGHLLAPMLGANPPEFPFVALLVSGGHTLLVKVAAFGEYQILGESVDDAAGEAFDKVAKLLGLSYPGGPAVSKLAAQGDVDRFEFPRPMTNRPGLDFSFSGLKTFVLNTVHHEADDVQTKADIACAFQEAVVDTLIIKCRRAMQQTGFKQLVMAGGVSANQRLREKLQAAMVPMGVELFYPDLSLCTDNGAMIAYAGYQRLSRGEQDPDLKIRVKARWPIDTI